MLVGFDKSTSERSIHVFKQTADLAARAQQLERKVRAHEQLVKRIAEKASHNHLSTHSSAYIDLLVDSKWLVEAKSLGDDAVRQARAALSQLYHYRFEYRDELPSLILVAAFTDRPLHSGKDLGIFLETCGIAVVWAAQDRFEGTDAAT